MVDVFSQFLVFMQEIVISFGVATRFLFTPYDLFGFTTIAPIMIISFGTLLLYLAVAIPKWLII